jgi:glutaredoxin
MIEIYSKDNCNLCLQAKNLLTALQKDFTLYKLDEDFSREELIQKFPNAKSFPVVVIDSEFVGSYNELKQRITTS